MPTSNILPVGTDDFDSNLNKVSSAVHYSSSPIKHEYEHDPAIPFGNEAAATTEKLESDLHSKSGISVAGFSHDESVPTPVKKVSTFDLMQLAILFCSLLTHARVLPFIFDRDASKVLLMSQTTTR
jgi:hypothetical protein